MLLASGRPPRASCGVLPVSIFRDTRVNYVMRRLGEATDEFFDALDVKLQEAMPDASAEERRRAMLEGLAQTVPTWSTPTVQQRVARLLELARDFEANLNAAFAIYVKDTYAEDLRGRRRKVQVCMPKLSAFVHMYFTRIVLAPEVKRGAYFDRGSTVARNFAVSNAMLDALAEVCVENVRVVDLEGGASPHWKAAPGPSHPQPSRSKPAGYVAAGSVAAGSVAAGSVAAGSVAAGSVAGGTFAGSVSGHSSSSSDASSAGASGSEDEAPAGAATGGPHPPRSGAPHPFDALMGGSAGMGGSGADGRFRTFVPPATAGGAAAGAAGAAAGAAQPPRFPGQAAPPAPALPPVPQPQPAPPQPQPQPHAQAPPQPHAQAPPQAPSGRPPSRKHSRSRHRHEHRQHATGHRSDRRASSRRTGHGHDDDAGSSSDESSSAVPPTPASSAGAMALIRKLRERE